MAKGTKTGGRKAGTPNKSTQALKDAILLAAEQVGQDGKGKGGLTGYLRAVAMQDVKAFASLLGRVLPLQINASVRHSVADISDAELAAIATGSSDGASSSPESPRQLN